VSAYDLLAGRYDGHFARPVDRWEDARLAAIITPHTRGRRVLDLAAGTGWVADHCEPAGYTAVDISLAMLGELRRKHPHAVTYAADVTSPGWVSSLPLADASFDSVTCTWGAHYLGDLAIVLTAVRGLVRPGGSVIFHGQCPRYDHRPHYIAGGYAHRGFTKTAVLAAAQRAGWPRPAIRGVGALPDTLTERLPRPLGHALWAVALTGPVSAHYSAAYVWRVPDA
jgi:ubiquinone/menaquinone biosynthesis C-methylase UbiE